MDNNFENKLWEKKLESGFTTPENYFSELQETIQARISAERLKELVPKDGYVVPEKYFEQLSYRILEKIAAEDVLLSPEMPVKQKARMIRLWHSSILKYASAACFLLVSIFGFYFYQHDETEKKPIAINLSSDQSFYDLDEQEIIEHLESDKKVETTTSASNTEIEDYILNNYSQNDITRNL